MNLRTLVIPVMLLTTTVFLSSCKKDPCKKVTCQNGGTCNDGTCICPAGFEGADCGVESRARFLGTYNATETCSGSYSVYEMTIGRNPSNGTTVLLNVSAGTLTANVMGNDLVIPSQVVYDGTIVSGTGHLTGNSLVIHYTRVFTSSVNACTITSTKN